MSSTRQKPMMQILMAKLPILLIVVGFILMSSLPSGLKHEKITITRDSFPVYGSADQNSKNGFVQLEIVSIEYIGKASKINTTRTSRGSITTSTYDQLYLTEDKDGRKLVYDDWDSTDRGLLSGYGSLEKKALPFRVYGSLTTVEKAFSAYDGYETSLKKYANYDLLKEVKHDITETRTTEEDNAQMLAVLRHLGMGMLILGILLIIVLKWRRKKEEQAMNWSDLSDSLNKP